MASSCAENYSWDNFVQNGVYEINDMSSNQIFKVYCDFTSEANFVWTLVESFKYDRRGDFNFPFYEDLPINENDPQFLEHRLSQSTMAHILSYATHLRATCEFEKGSLSNADYLRGKVADLDLMVQLYGPCITFEQISIRSVGCSDCQAKYWAGSGMHAHIASTMGESCSCPNCVVWLGTNSEDSFGLYGTRSTDHRCARDNQATTQWWLGVNKISPQ